MAKDLTVEDIDGEVRSKVYTQDYSPRQIIDGVKVVKINNFVGEDGDFSEVMRINPDGTHPEFPNFKIAQINRSRFINGAIKAWHLHFKQDEIWYLMPSNELVLGLWDIREDSPTKGQKMKLALGGGNSVLVYIPRGVAHGCINFSSKPANLFYFVSSQFDIKDPDEKRLDWDAAGADFWNPPRG